MGIIDDIIGAAGDVGETALDAMPLTSVPKGIIEGDPIEKILFRATPGNFPFALGEGAMKLGRRAGIMDQPQEPKKHIKLRKRIEKLADKLSPTLRAQALDVLSTAGILPKQMRKQVFANTLMQLPLLSMQEKGIQTAQNQASQRAKVIGEWLKKQNQPMVDSAWASAAALRDMIPSAGDYGPILQNQAVQQITGATRMRDAIVNSFMTQPILDAYDRQAQLMQSFNPYGTQQGGRY